MGKSQLMAQKDATAQKVLETYVLALYYQGCIKFAIQKRTESEMLLRQTTVMAEVGQKGEADGTGDWSVSRSLLRLYFCLFLRDSNLSVHLVAHGQ